MISEKHNVEKNKLHTNEQRTKSTDKEKSEKWKWARKSAEVKEVKKMEEEL